MTKKKVTRSRVATMVATMGMLVMSSGAVLMVTAPAANAAKTPVNICHATSSDTNPYVFITVDDDSAKFKGHLQHREDPNKKWKSDGTFNGVEHEDGDAKPDLIGDFTDDQGVFHEYDGEITEAVCNGEVEVEEAVADVDFTDPTCENANEASYDTTGEHVTFEETDGEAAPGAELEVTATADEGFTFEGGGDTQVFTHTFGDAVDLEGEPCVEVTPPPTVEPPTVTPGSETPPTVVRAGLVDTNLGQQGLILFVAGLLILAGAAGLGLTRSAGRQTI